MARYHGRSGVVYISSSGTGAAVTVASLSQWTLDFKRDKVDTTSFGDGNKTYVVGLKDCSGKISGFWDDTSSDLLFDASDSADGCKMYLYPSADAPSKFFSGPAWLDLSIDTSNKDAVKVSGDFSANGTWARS